jgi:hypothetical protein
MDERRIGTTGNTVGERNILMDLMELLLTAMEEDNGANVGNLDDYLMGFLTNRTTYDTRSPIQVACGKILRSRDCRNSCYGGETSDYFECDPMSLMRWLGKLELNIFCFLSSNLLLRPSTAACQASITPLPLAVANGLATVNVVNKEMSLSSGFSKKGYETLPFRSTFFRFGREMRFFGRLASISVGIWPPVDAVGSSTSVTSSELRKGIAEPLSFVHKGVKI